MYNEASGHFAAMLFLQRMRTPADRAFISQTFTDVWGQSPPSLDEQAVTVTPERLSIGWASLMRSSEGDHPARSVSQDTSPSHSSGKVGPSSDVVRGALSSQPWSCTGLCNSMVSLRHFSDYARVPAQR